MPSWIIPSDVHKVDDAGHVADHNHIADDLTLISNAVPVVSGGLTGATAATRFAGATASGAPVSGTFAIGDFVVDQSGVIWICTSAGTPGTWAKSSPTIPVSIAQGGTGSTTQQAALDAIAGAVTASQVLAGNGTHVLLRALAAADLPAVAALLTGATFTGFVAPAVVTLTFGASIAVNAALGNAFAVTLTASTGTLANPTNPIDGQVIRVRVIQDATGSRTLAYGTSYDFGTTGAPTLSTGASKVDILGFEYVASLSKWCYLGSGLGF